MYRTSVHRFSRLMQCFFAAAIASCSVMAAPPSTLPVEGLRENPPNLHAIVNATIVLEPGQVLEKGTIVIRDGSIVGVGSDLQPPPGALIHDQAGKRIYPGLIDAYAEISVDSPSGGARHWNSLVTPELSTSDSYESDAAINAKLRRQGVVCRLVAPGSGIVKGSSSIVSTSDLSGPQVILKTNVAQHVRLGMPRSRSSRGYPSSPMGAVALARQTFLDADWYPNAWKAFQGNRNLPQPERNLSLEALSESIDRGDRFIFDGVNDLYLLRADAFAREFSLNAILRGSGREYQRLDAVQATGRALIIPVSFPKPPAIDSPEAILDVSLTELLHWDIAPENPARLHAAGVRFALSTAELSDVAEFLSKVRVAVERGLPADAALAALTTVPAELFGISERFGRIASGRSASLLVTDGDLFEKDTKVLETWVEGKRYPSEGVEQSDINGSWELTITSPSSDVSKHEIQIQGKPSRLKGVWLIAKEEKTAEKVAFTKLALSDRTLTASLPGKSLGHPGVIQFSGTVIEIDSEPLRMEGRLAWPDGSISLLSAVRKAESPSPETKAEQDSQQDDEGKTEDETKPKPSDDEQPEDDAADEDEADEDKADDEHSDDEPTEDEQLDDEQSDDEQSDDEKESQEQPEPQPAEPPGEPGEASQEKSDEQAKVTGVEKAAADFPVNYPLGAFGRTEIPEQPKLLVIRHANIWTCADQGLISNGTVIIESGRITGVGKDLPIPEGALVIDATGKHLTPGMIDCHSHTATDGGINESTQAITAEVRVGDFVNCNDTDIYRQLAGGITTINILHGSANPIGGQNQVIKLRWGELFDQMRFAEAPAGIKFALGENVKRSNRPETSSERYPASRMGVEQIIRDAFQAAREYQTQWALWERDRSTLPPRKDLELEALSEILRGERWVHCHSYRQDEILALLRTCEEYGIRIATLQHILEGYKVADVMARHGAMGSAFSDWWAYKVEVYDAIPYNGALMHQAGIVVSFNSDDRELARHMNHEAAKAIRYGRIEPEEALKFVTLNPAKQLRIDEHVGSIEVGKHADFVVWSGPPLSLKSRCEQTWIDGRRYFDIEEDLQMRESAAQKRARLVQKVLSSGQSPASPSDQSPPEESLWPLEDEFCRARSLR